MKTSMVVTSLLLSIASLAFQVAKPKPKPAPVFEKYFGPATISEFDYHVMRVDEDMTRNSMVMLKGIAAPFIRKLSDDRQRVIVRVLVSEEDLPKAYDERKAALLHTAYSAASSVYSEFDLNPDQKGFSAVTVEFMSIEQLVKGKDSNKAKPYAEFTNDELTFH
jgi:hypothetical protein